MRSTPTKEKKKNGYHNLSPQIQIQKPEQNDGSSSSSSSSPDYYYYHDYEADEGGEDDDDGGGEPNTAHGTPTNPSAVSGLSGEKSIQQTPLSSKSSNAAAIAAAAAAAAGRKELETIYRSQSLRQSRPSLQPHSSHHDHRGGIPSELKISHHDTVAAASAGTVNPNTTTPLTSNHSLHHHHHHHHQDVQLFSQLMKSHQHPTAKTGIMADLAERGATLASITWLAAHVPTTVLNRLEEEVRALSRRFGTEINGNNHASKGGGNYKTLNRSGADDPEGDPEGDEEGAISDLSDADAANSEASSYSNGETPELHDSFGSHKRPLHHESSDNNSGGYVAETMRRMRRAGNSSGDLASPATNSHGRLRRSNSSNRLERFRSGRLSRVNSSNRLMAAGQTTPQQNSERSFGSSELYPYGDSHRNGQDSNHYHDADGDSSVERQLALKAIGLAGNNRQQRRHRTFQRQHSRRSSSQSSRNSYKDPFPFDSDDETQRKQTQTNHTHHPKSRNPHSHHSKRKRRDIGSDLLVLPHSSTHQSALLFVDISGFTRLATSLDPESLSKAINSYFELIVNQVTAFGGDVLKFAGDAVLVEWRVTAGVAGRAGDDRNHTQQHESSVDNQPLTVEDCVSIAAVCANQIVSRCSDFPIYAQHNKGQGSQVATLNVHCGVGVGEIVGVHVGDYKTRREYLILGDPIEQVSLAVNAASLGEVAASPEAIAILSRVCKLEIDPRQEEPVVIAHRNNAKFTSKVRARRVSDVGAHRSTISQTVESWPIDSLNQYRKLMALYVHPVVVANDSSNHNLNASVQERHREEAELRSVYTMFITPLISCQITGNPETDRHLYKLLNNIMNLCVRELTRFSGHLRQFIVDDKGLVLIATFGLRGSTFPNMVQERALPASITIHTALRHELGVQNQVGATIGNAYCGVVGGIKRHEYAVLGPSVNLAARLMSSPKNPGLLVDDAVRLTADKSYGFNALPPVKAKGYENPVPIFEPLNPLERSWGRVQANFVGRKKEIMKLMSMARDMAMSESQSKFVLISAESGMGKTTLVVHAIEHIRKLVGTKKRRLIITKHVSKESDLLVPFGIFRSILVDVLAHFKGLNQDDKSLASFISGGGMDSIGWESLSADSASGSTTTGLSSSEDRLSSICRELNAPPVFEELVGHHLLGMEKGREPTRRCGPGNNMKSLVSFMSKAFKRCTQEAHLVIVALDDMHNMDEMSWRVVQELFESGSNILFLGTSRPPTAYPLAVSRQFWQDLNTGYTKRKMFEHVKLKRLTDKEIRLMIAKTLGLQYKEVSSRLLNDVVQQSNGMPHFANEILETIKRRHTVGGFEETPGGPAYGSVGDLLLHRIDSFDAPVRNVLNLGAVLGLSFRLTEVVAVLRRIYPEEEDPIVHFDHATDSLDVAVGEGILYVAHAGSDPKDDHTDDFAGSLGGSNGSYTNHHYGGSIQSSQDGSVSNLEYTFCHDIWRTTILNLMLDSRKRDMHRIIAQTLEEQQGEDTKDYLSRMKLFGHWKASGDTIKSASLALTIGASFEELGLQDQAIKLYEDALDIWRESDARSIDAPIVDRSKPLLQTSSASELTYIIMLFTALAKCLANIHRSPESVRAYQDAVKTISTSPAADNLKDRSIVFPLFSGLFSALKYGKIEQDRECSYEQSLVSRYVHETKLHGDAVHYTRALAMQADLYARLGHYDKALQTHAAMVDIYDATELSESICAFYGSDRAAQSFSLSAFWYVMIGEDERAIEVCWYVLRELFPKMDPCNVHNSCILIYPILWILKDSGYSLEARDYFIRYVVEPFEEYFGQGRVTDCLPIYDPVLCILDLVGNGEAVEEDIEEYYEWALSEENLRFGTVLNNSLGGFGRCADCLSAEICVVLAERLVDCDDKRTLVKSGLELTKEVMALADEKRLLMAKSQCYPVRDRLVALAAELELEEE